MFSEENAKCESIKIQILFQIEIFIIIDLLTIYDKGEISNITDDFIKYLLDKRINL